MLRKCRPIPVQKFPTKETIVDRTNCLAFALGIKRAKRKKGEFSLEKTDEPIEITFLKKVKKLGFNQKQFRKISREDEAKTEGYIIRVYGFAKNVNQETNTISYDFHLIRREPDGKWVHKPGYYYPPMEVDEAFSFAIFQKYGFNFISFALDA